MRYLQLVRYVRLFIGVVASGVGILGVTKVVFQETKADFHLSLVQGKRHSPANLVARRLQGVSACPHNVAPEAAVDSMI
jgi:hypothetical protein